MDAIAASSSCCVSVLTGVTNSNHFITTSLPLPPLSAVVGLCTVVVEAGGGGGGGGVVEGKKATASLTIGLG